MTTPDTYFVYGTLRPGGRYWVNVAPFIEDYEPALLDGFVLYHLVDGYPAIEAGEGRVFGDLLVVRDGAQAHVREIMDRIEDYFPQDPRASLYERRLANVHRLRDLRGDPVEASIYVYNTLRSEYLHHHGVRVESGDWREYVTQDDSETGE